jgi:hypothetical protein
MEDEKPSTYYIYALLCVFAAIVVPILILYTRLFDSWSFFIALAVFSIALINANSSVQKAGRILDEGHRHGIVDWWLKEQIWRSNLAEIYRKREKLDAWGDHSFKDESNTGLTKSRTILVELLERCESEKRKFVSHLEDTNNGDDYLLYTDLNSVRDTILAEYTDARACASERLTELEQKIRGLRSKDTKQRRGAAEWAEEGSYEVAEPEPPPKWDS